MTDDPVMARIAQAIAAFHAGERDQARLRFETIWAEIAPDPQPLHACVLAHFMGDLQDDPAEELAWDLRALDAGLRTTQAQARAHHESLSTEAFLPSLHLNLGDDYLRLGDLAAARRHLDAGLAHARALPDTPLARMTLDGLRRLGERLAQTCAAPLHRRV